MTRRDFDVTLDSKSLLMIKSERISAPTQINAVLNWFEGPKHRVPTNQS